MARLPAYRKACKLQNVLYELVMAGKADPKVVASLAVAWDKLEERKRILAMKPLPKSVDVLKLAKVVKAQPVPSIDLMPPPATDGAQELPG